MERRSCDDRLKPPPHRGQYSVAVHTRRHFENKRSLSMAEGIRIPQGDSRS